MLKNTLRQVHYWLGRTSGLVVFIIAITGCLYAFQEEIQDIACPYRFVKAENKAFLLPSELEAIAHRTLPSKSLHSIKYNTPERAAEAIFYSYDPDYYYIIYLNPYSGEVLSVDDMNTGFFRFVLNGHFYLWLPAYIGQLVVSISTLIFFVMVLTGLYLWFPKNKATLRLRTWFRWDATTKWKRKNYDLHSIVGFYTAAFSLIFIFTGLVWGFQWFAYSYYTLWGGQKSLVYQDPVSRVDTTKAITKPLDAIYIQVRQETPAAQSIEVHPPETDSSCIAVNTNTSLGTYWQIDYRYFDQYSLEEKPVNHIYGRLKDAKLGDKIMRMNYDIHTGAILGFTGKVLAFLVSLLIASLPVTGILIWLKKRQARRQPKTTRK